MSENDRGVNDSQTEVSTLHVRIENRGSFFDRIEETVDSLETGDNVEEPSDRGLSLPDEEALARVFSAQNLQLIRAIAQHEPSSMRRLATIVDRDIKNVSQNLNELESLGLVDLVDEGRAKRPVVPYDEIEVIYPVRSLNGEELPFNPSPADD